MKKDFVIGVLGGMGTYATIHLFQQYAEVFEAEKEWDRPRMIIDNRCTMPSRVRAFLYNENVDQLVSEMADSMKRLKEAGCTRILLACNTSHLFLPAVYEKVPGLEPLVVHIIKECVETIKRDGVKEVYVLGTEGTIDSLDLTNRADTCILGCTELPIIYEKYKDGVTCRKVYDPLMLGVLRLKKEYDALN